MMQALHLNQFSDEHWYSEVNFYFLNPRLPHDQTQWLMKTLSQQVQAFQGHLFFLTSGTQSLKWVALSKKAFLASAQAVNAHLQSEAHDVWLRVLPEFHVGGMSVRARCFLSQARLVVLESWDPQRWIQWIQAENVTLTSLVPTQVYDLIQCDPPVPRSLRAILVGGGALSVAIYQKACQKGWPLLPTYGLTEACSQVATAELPVSGGAVDGEPNLKILPHWHLELTEQGLIRLAGESLLTAYVEPQGVRDPKQQGWFQTEDRALWGKLPRTLKILSRLQNFVKIAGESVHLDRLQAILDTIRLDHRIPQEIALVPVPDDRMGHVIHAWVQEGMDRQQFEALLQAYQQSVCPFEKIDQCHWIDQIPRHALGKLDWQACLQRLKQ